MGKNIARKFDLREIAPNLKNKKCGKNGKIMLK